MLRWQCRLWSFLCFRRRDLICLMLMLYLFLYESVLIFWNKGGMGHVIHKSLWVEATTVFLKSRCCLCVSLLPVSVTWRLPCQQRSTSLFSVSEALCEFSLELAEYECPLVCLSITLPPACLCARVFSTLKTWTMMTQATRSTPQGKYSGNKNNKWIFDCSQMWEEACWHWAKSLSRFCPPGLLD